MKPASEAEQWLSRYRHRADDLARRAASAQAALAAVVATAASRDGAVTVAVSPAGALHALTFGPPADDLSRTQLGVAILATYRRAHALAAEQAADTMRVLLGDGPTAALGAYLPAPAAAEEAP